MKAFFNWLSDIGIHEASFIAGGLGAAVAAFRMPGSLYERLGKFTIGFACALWGPSLVIKYLSLPEEAQFYGALGFVFGYFGMTVTDAIQETLNTIARHLQQVDWKTVVTGWISHK